MTCIMCQLGETRAGETSFSLERGGTTVLFKHVPASVCENCGEAYISDEVTGQLLETAKEVSLAGVEIVVRDFRMVNA